MTGSLKASEAECMCECNSCLKSSVSSCLKPSVCVSATQLEIEGVEMERGERTPKGRADCPSLLLLCLVLSCCISLYLVVFRCISLLCLGQSSCSRLHWSCTRRRAHQHSCSTRPPSLLRLGERERAKRGADREREKTERDSGNLPREVGKLERASC